MSVIDLDKLLKEIAPDDPCGEDLEHDDALRQLDKAAQGEPERQKGNAIIPAVPPEWRDVQKRALALFERSKDIRVAVHLACAVLDTSGLPAFADSLALIRGLLERYWEGVYPRLDPEDDNDPTERINAIVALCDPATMLRDLREVPLVSSRAFGRFGLRAIQIAKGELPPPANTGDSLPSAATIDGAFSDGDPAELEAVAEAVAAAIKHLTDIDSHLTDQVGSERAPDFGDLLRVLRDMQRVLGEPLARRGIGGAAAGGAATAAPAQPAPAPAAAAAPGRTAAPGAALSGEVVSREDVIRFIDKACAYYKLNEPSSPVPLLLLLRARRLVTMDFMEIMRDLAPDGVAQATMVTGVDREG